MTTSAQQYLLTWISLRESKGNYDAYIGHSDAPAGTVTSLTIAKIYDFQRRLLDDGEPSTAVGKYQFLQRTLSSLAQRSGTDIDTTIFSADIQDQFATILLEDRGWNAWVAGIIDDNEFMHRLSCEWASLPDPFNDGRSHYDGDLAGNHAGRSLIDFTSAINKCKSMS